MEQMLLDGITDVIVQPTHVINGIENDQMKADALSFRDRFSSIVFGDPLLTTEEDNQAVVQAVAGEFQDMDQETALVLMGHGTEQYANSVYAALDYRFKDMGHKNIFLGTVEAYPALDSLLRAADSFQPKKIVLAPFMIVAGDHAQNDLAGEDPDSWRISENPPDSRRSCTAGHERFHLIRREQFFCIFMIKKLHRDPF